MVRSHGHKLWSYVISTVVVTGIGIAIDTGTDTGTGAMKRKRWRNCMKVGKTWTHAEGRGKYNGPGRDKPTHPPQTAIRRAEQ